jgi:transposase
MECTINYVGIDVSKATFDVCMEGNGSYSHYHFSNDKDGFQKLLLLMKDSNDYQVVMEASGPYYLRLATYLYESAVLVSVVNPLVIRRFCQMRLSRAKTDKKDAKMIALYAKAEHPPVWEPDAGYVQELRQIQAAIKGLEKSRISMERQMEAFSQNPIASKEAIKALKTSCKTLEKQIKMLEQKMEQLVGNYHGALLSNLKSIPGIGKKTAMQLIVASGAFRKFSNAKQLISYFGLSPRIFVSGTSVKGKAKITKMGMSRIRAMLYVCAWSAKKHNKACKEFYERLLAKGKSKRLALIAVANKLIRQAFAIATNNQTYQPI